MVKRDGCEISRRTSKKVLGMMMENRGGVEVAAEAIYRYLEELEKYLGGVQMKRDYKEFLLAKTLNKLPS